ncbi:dynein regulatory complex subunit 4-like isoform X2 [Limanda limanda]|uniref:dynein regulatory complex subunit 4-like isoform X2 n=1 Tax=Limanda limanda TaxID=27771 RepID=UPI0029C7DAC6|nr:dynein regulatory complex subunit 4-like isoform X2 [Limanda limanda]
MAPKSKSKKPGKMKSSAVVDSLSTEDMSKDQLEEHVARLREELEREREERSFFQLERDKIQTLWETSRRDVEQGQDELRQRRRERDETQQRHRVEISVYKQKLKHVLSEQHHTVSELKMDAAAAAALIQNRHAGAELELRSDTLPADASEKMLRNTKSVEELKLVALLGLTNNYDRRIRDLEVKFNKRMQATMQVEERKRRSEVNELEDRMDARVVALVEDHGRALRRAEEYYSSIQNKVLADEKVLKEEAAEVQKQLTRVSNQLSVAQRENKRLRESVHAAEQTLPELQLQLHQYNQSKAQLLKSGARAKEAEKQLWDLTMEHELLLQAFEKVQQERDELLRKQREVIVELQQRSGLKQLLLERKLAALTQTVDTKEAQLCGALSTAAAAGSSAAHRLKETLESKHATIGALEAELAGERQEYEQLLQSCSDRLQALGVAQHDFRPTEQI